MINKDDYDLSFIKDDEKREYVKQILKNATGRKLNDVLKILSSWKRWAATGEVLEEDDFECDVFAANHLDNTCAVAYMAPDEDEDLDYTFTKPGMKYALPYNSSPKTSGNKKNNIMLVMQTLFEKATEDTIIKDLETMLTVAKLMKK